MTNSRRAAIKKSSTTDESGFVPVVFIDEKPLYDTYHANLSLDPNASPPKKKRGRKPSPRTIQYRKIHKHASKMNMEDNQRRLQDLEERNRMQECIILYLRNTVYDLKMQSLYLRQVVEAFNSVLTQHNVPISEVDELFSQWVKNTPTLPSQLLAHANLSSENIQYILHPYEFIYMASGSTGPEQNSCAKHTRDTQPRVNAQSEEEGNVHRIDDRMGTVSQPEENQHSLFAAGNFSPDEYTQRSSLEPELSLSPLNFLDPAGMSPDPSESDHAFTMEVSATEHLVSHTSPHDIKLEITEELPDPPGKPRACSWHNRELRYFQKGMSIDEAALFLWQCYKSEGWPGLEPSNLQLNVAHDERIDLIPSAYWRDRLIINIGHYDTTEFFCDLYTRIACRGDPLLPQSYLIDPSLYRKYPFLIDPDCPYAQTLLLELMLERTTTQRALAAINGCVFCKEILAFIHIFFNSHSSSET
ncbi:uncharacterized protein VTP21DRAFT_6173 [Calcarisporiella thermophila]|uniref:uncharacterized protein n=1 Tax=Calcarisporiella thermophila TaxID=911321 RepID=UPI003743DD15